MPRSSALAICALPLILAGCGYHFQGDRNPLQDLGIHKIYVAEFRNTTYRPGIEQFFTNAMVREIAKSKSFALASTKAEADAVLSGVVNAAESSGSGATKSFQL